MGSCLYVTVSACLVLSCANVTVVLVLSHIGVYISVYQFISTTHPKKWYKIFSQCLHLIRVKSSDQVESIDQDLHLIVCYNLFQLRYLQTLNTVSAEKNSTIIFPVPIDLISNYMRKQFCQQHLGLQQLTQVSLISHFFRTHSELKSQFNTTYYFIIE